MSGVPGLHPLVVHFPIVLLPAAFVLELLNARHMRSELRVAAHWALWVGTLTAALAVYTGHESAERASAGLTVRASMAVAAHHDMGIVALIVAVMLSALSLLCPERRSLRARVGYLMLLMGLVADLAVGAHLGGHLVFREGVGVSVGGRHSGARSADASASGSDDRSDPASQEIARRFINR